MEDMGSKPIYAEEGEDANLATLEYKELQLHPKRSLYKQQKFRNKIIEETEKCIEAGGKSAVSVFY